MGPKQGVFAANFAYNNGEVDGSVTNLAVGGNMDFGNAYAMTGAVSENFSPGIHTTAAGAINTGTISMGFNGSAFHSGYE